MVRRGCRRRLRGVARRAGGVAWIVSSASCRALEGLGHRELPLRRVGRSRRRCLRRGRGHIRQCGRSSCSIGISIGGVCRRQSRGLSLVAPPGSLSSFARCLVPPRVAVRPLANRCNWLAVASVAVCPAAVDAVDEAAVAAAADPLSAVCALRAVRVRVVCAK